MIFFIGFGVKHLQGAFSQALRYSHRGRVTFYQQQKKVTKKSRHYKLRP
jgi:hypothetical protein